MIVPTIIILIAVVWIPVTFLASRRHFDKGDMSWFAIYIANFIGWSLLTTLSILKIISTFG